MSIRAINWAVEVSIRIGIPYRNRLTLWALARHHHDKTGQCFPSYETLSLETGYKRRKVIYNVQELEFNGLIIRQSRRVSGHQSSNHFVLFGRPKFNEWCVSRVHHGAPCQGARACTPPRVHVGAPNKGDIYTRDYNTPGSCEVVPFEPAPSKDKIDRLRSGGGAA